MLFISRNFVAATRHKNSIAYLQAENHGTPKSIQKFHNIIMSLASCIPGISHCSNVRQMRHTCVLLYAVSYNFLQLALTHVAAASFIVCEPFYLLFDNFSYSTIFSSPILAVATFTYEEYGGTEVPVCLTQADTFWSALFFILTIAVFFIIPLGVLLVLYSVIAKNLMENPVIISQHKNGNNAGNVLRYRKQVILMLGTVVLSFFVCLLPFKALTLWIIVFPPETIMSLGVDGYYILLYFCRVMLYLNSAINPILYNLMSSKFREGFVKLLRINKLMKCSRNFRQNMQRRDTFNTTTSTGFSSSQNTSDSFWKRYSNRASSQKNISKESKKTKEVKAIVEAIIPKTKEPHNFIPRRNSMKIIAEMNEVKDKVSEIINDMKRDNQCIEVDEDNKPFLVEIHDNRRNKEAINETATENNKQIQILNLDAKTNNVYSITLINDRSETRNRFVCVPTQDREKNIFVYDFTSKESFV